MLAFVFICLELVYTLPAKVVLEITWSLASIMNSFSVPIDRHEFKMVFVLRRINDLLRLLGRLDYAWPQSFELQDQSLALLVHTAFRRK
jgi:hypothetical protein